MADESYITELVASFRLPTNPFRMDALQEFFNRTSESIDNYGKILTLDFDITSSNEIGAYYEDESKIAFYFQNKQMRQLIKDNGTMRGTALISDFNNDIITIKLRVYSKAFFLQTERSVRDLQRKVNEVERMLAESEEQDENAFCKKSLSDIEHDIYVHYDDQNGDEQTVFIRKGEIISAIVGMKKRENYDILLPLIAEGKEVLLKPEPDNPFDKNAIAAYIEDKLMGYIPRRRIPVVAACVDDDGTLATIHRVSGDNVDVKIKATFNHLLDRTISNGLIFEERIVTKEPTCKSTSYMFNSQMFFDKYVNNDAPEIITKNKSVELTNKYGVKLEINIDNLINESLSSDDKYDYVTIKGTGLECTVGDEPERMIYNDDAIFICYKSKDKDITEKKYIIIESPNGYHTYNAYLNDDEFEDDDNDEILKKLMHISGKAIAKPIDYESFNLISDMLCYSITFRVAIPKEK